tara:strand:+ start:66 stop:245 length:180 start_codon:yes stop_codon:yes gene_type:complete
MAKIKLNQGRKGNEKAYDYHYERALREEARLNKLPQKERDDEIRKMLENALSKIGPNRV